MKSKRKWKWIVIVVLCLMLVKCGADDNGDETQPERSMSGSEVAVSGQASDLAELPVFESTEEVAAEPTEATTPEPAEVMTPEPTEVPTPEPTEVPTPESTEAPVPEPTEAPMPEPTPEPAEMPKAYAVNDKNGKIHMVGQCSATGTGENAMERPVYFSTYEEAEDYSESRKPQLEKRKCGNCW